MLNVRIWNFMRNSSRNSHAVVVGCLTLYFSYESIIAFDAPETGKVVRENSWGSTTGKHLNAIDEGKVKARLPSAEFEGALKRILERYALMQVSL